MRKQSEQPTYPQHHEDEVPEEGVRAVVMVAARGRVAFHAQRHDHEDSAHQQEWLGAPARSDKPADAHRGREPRSKQPHLRSRDIGERIGKQLGVEDLSKRGSRRIGKDERDFQHCEDRGDQSCKRANPFRDVSIHGERRCVECLSVVFPRRNEEGGGQEGAHGGGHGNPCGGTNEG